MSTVATQVTGDERKRAEELRVKLVEARNEIAQLKHENADLRSRMRQRTAVLLWAFGGLLLAAAAMVLVR
jgi:hypothetical protein